MNRRGFMQAILAAGMAPAVVRAESLMRLLVPKLWVPADGIGDRLVLPAELQFGDNPFTIEWWYRPNSLDEIRVSACLREPVAASDEWIHCAIQRGPDRDMTYRNAQEVPLAPLPGQEQVFDLIRSRVPWSEITSLAP